MRARISQALVLMLLSACRHEDNGGLAALDGICQSVGGGTARITSTTTDCDADPWENLQAALDMNYQSFALLRGPATNCNHNAERTIVNATAQAGVVFPAGQSAGALMRPAPGVGGPGSSFQMTVTTYLEGVPQNSAVAVSYADTMGHVPVASGPNEVVGEDGYYGINTTSSYDSVELDFEVSGICRGGDGCTDDVRIYEVCTR